MIVKYALALSKVFHLCLDMSGLSCQTKLAKVAILAQDLESRLELEVGGKTITSDLSHKLSQQKGFKNKWCVFSKFSGINVWHIASWLWIFEHKDWLLNNLNPKWGTLMQSTWSNHSQRMWPRDTRWGWSPTASHKRDCTRLKASIRFRKLPTLSVDSGKKKQIESKPNIGILHQPSNLYRGCLQLEILELGTAAMAWPTIQAYPESFS